MRILYGVCGEGMGHATRTKVAIAHLRARGHRILVVASDQALRVLGSSAVTGAAAAERVPPSTVAAAPGGFSHHPDEISPRNSLRVVPIVGLGMRCVDGSLDLRGTLEENAQRLPQMLMTNAPAWAEAEAFRPDIVITDYDSFAWFYATAHRLPLISIDNAQILPRCDHLAGVFGVHDDGMRALEAITVAKAPDAGHYIVTSFFYPPVKPSLRTTTTIVPPILRREVLKVVRTRPPISDHVLVYKTSSLDDAAFLSPLAAVPEHRFIAYGIRRKDGGMPSNVTARPYDEQTFLDDLASARAVVANGGMSLIGEALALDKPLYAVPVRGQYEQVMNACYLERLGYGVASSVLDPNLLRAFLQNLPRHIAAIHRSPQHDENRALYAALDSLI